MAEGPHGNAPAWAAIFPPPPAKGKCKRENFHPHSLDRDSTYCKNPWGIILFWPALPNCLWWQYLDGQQHLAPALGIKKPLLFHGMLKLAILIVLFLCTFGVPGIRPDARHVSRPHYWVRSYKMLTWQFTTSVPNAGLWVPIQNCSFLHMWLVSGRPPPQNP